LTQPRGGFTDDCDWSQAIDKPK